MNSANLGDVDLNYWDQGDGPALVLLHGFPLNHSMWKYQIEEFISTHRVIVPDLRGHGRSSVTAGTVTMSEMAQDVASLLDHLGVDEPISLGGLSMGGYVAWEFWRQFGGRLDKLLLFDTRAQADTAEVARGRTMMAAQVIADGTAIVAVSMAPKLVSPVTLAQEPERIEELRAMIRATDVEAIAATQRGMAARIDMTSRLSDIDVPTLVVCGEYDEISPPEEMQSIAAALPQSTFVRIPKAGHLSPWEQPRAVNGAIRDFVRKHSK